MKSSVGLDSQLSFPGVFPMPFSQGQKTFKVEVPETSPRC